MDDHELMMLVWGDSLRELGISNESCAGDLIEALLGWHYILTIKRGQTVGNLANETIEMLEPGPLAVWALWKRHVFHHRSESALYSFVGPVDICHRTD